jgi:hypothetical protein
MASPDGHHSRPLLDENNFASTSPVSATSGLIENQDPAAHPAAPSLQHILLLGNQQHLVLLTSLLGSRSLWHPMVSHRASKVSIPQPVTHLQRHNFTEYVLRMQVHMLVSGCGAFSIETTLSILPHFDSG